MWEVTNWDKKFNGVENYKQTKVLNYKHISADELKKIAVDNGNIKLLSTGIFDGYTNESLAKENINSGEIVSIPSGGAANIKYYNGKFVDSGNILCSSIDNSFINLKFIYYHLKNREYIIQSFFRGSSVQHPEMSKILELKIKLTTIEKQDEIVSKLDKLDTLCNDLTSGLPAEIEARKKQYEYYRDKLLSFD